MNHTVKFIVLDHILDLDSGCWENGTKDVLPSIPNFVGYTPDTTCVLISLSRGISFMHASRYGQPPLEPMRWNFGMLRWDARARRSDG
jgi:hypothetical protein